MTLTSSNLDHSSGPQPLEEYADAPVWLQRTFLVVFVLFCMSLGLVLVRLPWSDAWFEDGFAARWPMVQYWLHQGFVRGAISGLGLIDIWLGVLEVLHYRIRRPGDAGPSTGLDKVSHDQQR